MKKVLLLDTNVASFPIYEFLLKNGYDVYVAGGKVNDCLAKYTEKYINFDYSDIDLLNRVIDEYSFDYLVPGCNDMSYICATKANNNSKFFGLDTTENSELINNKLKFRKFAIDNKLNVPQIYSKDGVYKSNEPIIVKPVDAYSGRGVSVVKTNSKQYIDDAISNAIQYSKNGECVIEEYVEGQLYSHSAFLRNKEIFIDFFVIEDGTTNKFTVDTSHVVYDFPTEIRMEIKKQIETIAEKLNLVDGLIHTQFIKTKNSFKIIEVTRRCPGDLYNFLIENSTGFNYAEFYTRPFINQKIDGTNIKTKNDYILRHTISVDKLTGFIGIEFNEEVSIKQFIPMAITGDILKESPFSRFGLIFVECKSYENLKSLYHNILNRKFYQLK
jgi:predicted ATP-grasp superfamily ATP-dependent carboligase